MNEEGFFWLVFFFYVHFTVMALKKKSVFPELSNVVLKSSRNTLGYIYILMKSATASLMKAFYHTRHSLPI